MASLDGCSGPVLGSWLRVLTDISSLSLAQAAVPTCFKTTSIVPVPEPHRLPPCCTDPHHHEVLREVGPGSPQNLLTWTPSNSPTARTEVRRMPFPRQYTPPFLTWTITTAM